MELYYSSRYFLGFFIFCVFICTFLVFKVIVYIKARKTKKDWETIASVLTSETGEKAMKEFFQQAISGVNAELDKKPITGNEQLITSIFGEFYKRSEEQAHGLAQLMSVVTFQKAANAQQSEMDDMIRSIRGEIHNQKNGFDSQASGYAQNALGKQQQAGLENNQQAPTVKQNTQKSDGDDAANNTILTLVSSPPQVEIREEDPEERALVDAIKKSWLAQNLTKFAPTLMEGECTIMDIPVCELSKLIGAFNVRIGKTKEEIVMHKALQVRQEKRSMMPARKIAS